MRRWHRPFNILASHPHFTLNPCLLLHHFIMWRTSRSIQCTLCVCISSCVWSRYQISSYQGLFLSSCSTCIGMCRWWSWLLTTLTLSAPSGCFSVSLEHNSKRMIPKCSNLGYPRSDMVLCWKVKVTGSISAFFTNVRCVTQKRMIPKCSNLV